MVQGIIRTLQSSVRGLHQAAYVLAALTLVSQVLALLRDRIFAHAFGASETLDLYYAAFKVPDLVFALVASLVSAYVLIPRIAGNPGGKTRELLSQAASFLLIGGGVIAAVLAVAMPWLLALIFPDLSGGARGEEFVELARLLLLQPILLGLSGVLTSVTQVERRFTLFALSPVLYNLGIIGGAIALYPSFGLAGIGIGVVIGAALHLAIHIPVLARAGVLPGLTLPSGAVVWSIAKDSLPRSLALSFGALTTLVLTMLAAQAEEGSIALFSLAANLEAVPLALIGASYATAAFPVLSEEANAGKSDAFRATLSAAGRHVIFWSSVIAVLAIVLRAHLVRVVYGTGAFDWDATRLTAALLAVLVVGLAAQGIVLLVSRAFYAARRSWLPLALQASGLMVSVGAAAGLLVAAEAHPGIRYFVESLLRLEDLSGTSIVFIAVGATLGQLVMAAFALMALGAIAPGVARSYLQPLFEGAGAGIVGGAAAYGVLAALGTLAPLTSLSAVFTQGLVAGMVGLAASAAVLALLENREFRDLYESLRKLRFSKALSPSGTVLNDKATS